MHANDEIVEIPENRIKFFGTRGKMLLPSPQSIAAIVEKIPPGQIITTGLLREQLATQFEVEGVCPVTTKKSLVVIANDVDSTVPYWRVINQNGNVISNLADSADKLREEGISIAADGKKVSEFKIHITNFD